MRSKKPKAPEPSSQPKRTRTTIDEVLVVLMILTVVLRFVLFGYLAR